MKKIFLLSILLCVKVISSQEAITNENGIELNQEEIGKALEYIEQLQKGEVTTEIEGLGTITHNPVDGQVRSIKFSEEFTKESRKIENRTRHPLIYAWADLITKIKNLIYSK